MKQLIPLLIFLLAFLSCETDRLGQAPVSDQYEEEIDQWAADHVESLKEPTGWLRLAGMYFLEEGENSFGSGPDRDVRFPEGTIPEHAGTFILQDGNVTMKVKDGVTITHQEEDIDEMTIFDGKNAPEIEHGSLEWFVIQREEIIAIRLFNKDNPKADRFTGFPRYPTDESWHLNARFIPNPPNTTISIVNVLNQIVETPSPGVVEFRVDGELYTLDALEASDDRLFLIVGDQTNGDETYQAGRFMYVDEPQNGDRLIIDFNKIYNPPCAYNLHTTCQLPPPQNRLDLAITAGEKRPIDWDGL